MLKNLIKSDKFFVLADQVVVSATAFLTNLLLARALGLHNYGIYSFIGLVQFFCLSISMGIVSQIYQVVYPAKAEKERKKYTDGLLYILFALLTVFLIAGILLYLFTPANWLVYKNAILLSTLSTLLFLLQDFLRKVLLTQQQFVRTFVIDTTTNLLQLIFLFITWQLNILTLHVAIIIIGATFIPSVILGLIWLSPGKPVIQQINETWREQKGKTGWMLMSNILQWGTGYFFVIAASWWVSASALGALRLGQYIFGLLNVVLQAIENYVLPKASAVTKNQNEYLKAVAKKMIMLMLPVLAILSLFAKQILLITGGQEFVQYTYVMYGLAIIYLLITIGYPVRIAIRSQSLNKQYFIGYILSMLFSFSSVYWLLNTYQLVGVLIGLFIIQCITIGYWIMVLQKRKILSWKSFILF